MLKIIKCIQPQDWFAAIDLKDAYFHVSILLRHRPFLQFARFEVRHSPSGSLSPCAFTKVVEGALALLREVGVRVPNYLDNWPILAQSREQLCDHKDLVLRHLSQLGLRVNWEKSKLSPVQRISFRSVELDSVSMTACLTDERAQAVLNCLSFFRGRNVVPLKQFQRLLGHMASAAAVMPLGLLHMRPLQHWLHSRVPRWAWHRGTLRVNITQQCRRSLSPWTGLAFLRAGVPLEQVSRHTVVTTDASSMGWGATCNRQAASGLWTGPRPARVTSRLRRPARVTSRLRCLVRPALVGSCLTGPTWTWPSVPSPGSTSAPPPSWSMLCVKRLEAALRGGGLRHESGCHSLKLHITHGLHLPSCTTLTHSRPPLHQSHSCHHSLISLDCLTSPAPHSLTHI